MLAGRHPPAADANAEVRLRESDGRPTARKRLCTSPFEYRTRDWPRTRRQRIVDRGQGHQARFCESGDSVTVGHAARHVAGQANDLVGDGAKVIDDSGVAAFAGNEFRVK